jgi:uncharacterized membrane protein
MRTLTIVVLAALLMFFGYRAVNPQIRQTVNQSQVEINHNQPQLVEVIIEEVEE